MPVPIVMMLLFGFTVYDDIRTSVRHVAREGALVVIRDRDAETFALVCMYAQLGCEIELYFKPSHHPKIGFKGILQLGLP